jgi:serine/threonine-protein kinase
MAKVYRARHSVLDTRHALKVLDPKYRLNAEARKRFLDEAKIQAKHLNHPNIVKVTNIVATSDVAALVMDLVEGGNLEGLIEKRRKPLENELFMEIALPILDAIGHAHDVGIIHRDIKPANVLIDEKDGRRIPMVTDFGIAKVGENVSTKKKSTHADARMGTLAYMSPEQIRQAKNVTARSDVFAIGAMFYEMATGRVPFDGESDFDIMEKIVHGRFEEPEKLAASPLPKPILAAIERAMNPDPDKRFASCKDFAAAIQGHVVPGPSRTRAATSSSGGGPRWAMFGVLAVLALGAAGAAVFFATRKAETRAVVANADAGVARPVPSGAPPADAAQASTAVVKEERPDAAPPPPPDAAPPPKPRVPRKPRDTDGDGIPDSRDRCPTRKEDKDGIQDSDGCPETDADGDGIPDTKDKCPLEKERFNFKNDEDGCPD